MNNSMVTYQTQAKKAPQSVYFNASTALRKGQGVFWQRDVGTATSADGSRGKYVIAGTSSYPLCFAGVAAQAYNAVTGGQEIAIYTPGSVCEVSICADTTVNSGIISCLVSPSAAVAGTFGTGGIAGLGAAIPLQTNSSGTIGQSLDGSAIVSASTTLTKTGLFANAAAGDYVFLFAGATNSTMATAATAGRYTISSVTSNDAVELTTAPGNGICAVSVVSGNQTCLAYLLEGPDYISGCSNWVTPLANAAAAPGHMVSGYNFVLGGTTLATGDSTATLADGTFIGQQVVFKLMGALTTNDYLVTTTTAKQLDGSTTLASMEFDGANDESRLEWMGPHWKLLSNAGTGLA